MKFEDVKKLIMLIRQNDIAEVEIEEPNLRIRIRRDSVPETTDAGSDSKTEIFQKDITKQIIGKEEEKDKPVEISVETEQNSFDEDRYKKVYAPLVGTFYRAPAPDAEFFIEVGDVIQKDTVICIIEAMKVMNEIQSEHSGRVVAVPVENATPVEYGEPICIIDPFI